MSIPLIQIKCQNCGGSLNFNDIEHIGICNYCDSKYILDPTNKKIQSAECHFNLINNSLSIQEDNFKQNLINKIKFLENQYIETKHPAILIKIKNIQQKLLLLENK